MIIDFLSKIKFLFPLYKKYLCEDEIHSIFTEYFTKYKNIVYEKCPWCGNIGAEIDLLGRREKRWMSLRTKDGKFVTEKDFDPKKHNFTLHYEIGLGDRVQRLINLYEKSDKAKGRYDKKLFIKYSEFKKMLRHAECSYCGENDFRNLGLDRIDNDRGHNSGNVVICCAKCNFTRGDRYSYEEFLQFRPVLEKINCPEQNLS